MSSSSITSKGQVTIPAELRAKLDLHQGDMVSFKQSNDGILIMKQKNKIQESFGILTARKGVSLEDMQSAIEKGASDDRA